MPDWVSNRKLFRRVNKIALSSTIFSSQVSATETASAYQLDFRIIALNSQEKNVLYYQLVEHVAK